MTPPSNEYRESVPRSTMADPMTLRIGDLLPEIELVDHNGQPWRTVELRGRPLVLILHRHLA